MVGMYPMREEPIFKKKKKTYKFSLSQNECKIFFLEKLILKEDPVEHSGTCH